MGTFNREKRCVFVGRMELASDGHQSLIYVVHPTYYFSDSDFGTVN
jgi:hypothetical protein